MMATAAVVGLNAGKRLLSSSFYYSDLSDRISYTSSGEQHHVTFSKNVILAKASSYASSSSSLHSHTHSHSRRHSESSIKALKECADSATTSLADADAAAAAAAAADGPWMLNNANPFEEEDSSDSEASLEALLLFHKSMLEKQLELSFEQAVSTNLEYLPVTSSGLPARLRRINARKGQIENKKAATVSPELFEMQRGTELLAHAQVVNLSHKIQHGLSLQQHREKLKQRLGYEVSDDQLATSLRMTLAELKVKLKEYALAKEILVKRNVRLVMKVARRYENTGADMAALIQGGLVGLHRGIEKFDASKGFKLSTYVYWWIRQGVSRALNSRTIRLPTYLHERLNSIRNAKRRLEEEGIDPTIDRLAEHLNMSRKKIENATRAAKTELSLDRAAFSSLSGLPGENYHSYIADNHLENNPWHGIDECTVKVEVKTLISTALRDRERDIVRLYYGLDHECLTWEEISKRIGLSRERVRQVGLVAVEKLRHAAKKKRMEALLVEH